MSSAKWSEADIGNQSGRVALITGATGAQCRRRRRRPAPQERFGTGGAVNQTARQIGAVLGVAVLIAIVGPASSVDQALDRVRIAWLVGAAAALGSATISSFHRRPSATSGAVPVVLAPADAA